MARDRKAVPFPTREQVAAFIADSPAPVTRREIARAFQITGADRIPLKALMKELAADGLIEPRRRRQVAQTDSLPEVLLVRITRIDGAGDVIAVPADWQGDAPPPAIVMAPERPGQPALAVGDRVVARLARRGPDEYDGRTVRRLPPESLTRVVGILRRQAGDGVLQPADRRIKEPIWIAAADGAGADDGELVLAEVPTTRRVGGARARVVQRLGSPTAPGSVSLVAIHAAGIPTEFPRAAVDQAEAAGPPRLDGRADLRSIPLVTIDGADARDFDDAVWAAPDADPGNEGGWTLLVAIADVAAYVPPGSPLDREALRRGNSVYFPDRVVPMLPEALSNGWCSLRPDEDRACLAVTITIDREGRQRRHRFQRGLMRSAARLTYEQVQAAHETDSPDLRPIVAPLYGAFGALGRARTERGTLDLDVPERVVTLTPEGEVAAIGERARLDSHRLIEEFMIAANVAAAATLQDGRMPCLFRVHDTPDRARVEALREFLESLGYTLPKGQVLRPRAFTQILARAAGRPEAALINEVVLRSQAQAVYSPENLGHFGLALPRYAHFTSPIRRYADLTVHRGLIRLLRLGDDGAPDQELAELEAIGTQVSQTERRAAQAERDAVDRYVARYLGSRIGQTFTGRIGGVARFGLFVTLDETGADGLVPVSTLPDDFYEHDERGHALVGKRWGRAFRLGARVRVRLAEADPLSGSTVFQLLDAADGADPLGDALAQRQRQEGRVKGRSAGAKRPVARTRRRS